MYSDYYDDIESSYVYSQEEFASKIEKIEKQYKQLLQVEVQHEKTLSIKRKRWCYFWSILSLIFFLGIFWTDIQTNDLQNEIVTLEEELDKSLDKYHELEIAYEDIEIQAVALEEALYDTFYNMKDVLSEFSFYNAYAVTVASNSGEKYHKYGCHYMKGRPFYIFDKETAIAQGYKPCSSCYKEDIK